MQTKTCTGCGEVKGLGGFPKRGGGKYKAKCKECTNKVTREWYHSNPDARSKRISKVARNTANHRRRMRDKVNELKRKPCMDCGKSFPPVAMDFHHRDSSQKVGEVPFLVQQGYSWKRILEEIAKCDLLCAVCHRLRHHGLSQRLSQSSTGGAPV